MRKKSIYLNEKGFFGKTETKRYIKNKGKLCIKCSSPNIMEFRTEHLEIQYACRNCELFFTEKLSITSVIMTDKDIKESQKFKVHKVKLVPIKKPGPAKK